MNLKNSLALVGTFFILPLSAAFAQGPLTPPGPPAATMKTLDQIQPRTPIDTNHTPGDANNLCIITQPGSYYFTANLVATDFRNGITVLTNDVTIDLNGFSLIGHGGYSGIGQTDISLHGLTVRNGVIRDWGSFGIFVEADSVRLEDLTVENNSSGAFYVGGNVSEINHCVATGFTGAGFHIGPGSIVRNCAAVGNFQVGTAGFEYFNGCTLTACTAQNCAAGFSSTVFGGAGTTLTGCAAYNDNNGFTLASYLTLTGCSAYNCISNGFYGPSSGGCSLLGCTVGGSLIGINVGPNTTLASCTASSNYNIGINTGSNTTLNTCNVSGNFGIGIITSLNNTLTACVASGNLAGGIFADANCTFTGCVMNQNGSGTNGLGLSTSFRATIANCSADQNQNDGIRVGGDSSVTGSHASFNGRGVVSAGIRATGGGSRIDGNQTRDNTGYGILTTGFDIVTRNFSGGSVTNYFPVTATGGFIAPILTPATATNALANF